MEEQRARQEAEERKAASESAAAGAAEPGAGRSLLTVCVISSIHVYT